MFILVWTLGGKNSTPLIRLSLIHSTDLRVVIFLTWIQTNYDFKQDWTKYEFRLVPLLILRIPSFDITIQVPGRRGTEDVKETFVETWTHNFLGRPWGLQYRRLERVTWLTPNPSTTKDTETMSTNVTVPRRCLGTVRLRSGDGIRLEVGKLRYE